MNDMQRWAYIEQLFKDMMKLCDDLMRQFEAPTSLGKQEFAEIAQWLQNNSICPNVDEFLKIPVDYNLDDAKEWQRKVTLGDWDEVMSKLVFGKWTMPSTPITAEEMPAMLEAAKEYLRTGGK